MGEETYLHSQRLRLVSKDSYSGSGIYQGKDYTVLAKCEACRRFNRTIMCDILNKAYHQNIKEDKLGTGIRTVCINILINI